MLFNLGNLQPQVATSAWVAPGAHVIGQVVLEVGVSVWFGAVVRGDSDQIRIGAGSNLQDGVVVHADPGFPCRVGQRCVIGHRAVLHGCTLGDEVLIGIGAIILNGATVPDGCMVGAGALVPEGKQLEPDSLYVGVPARKVRTLGPEDRARTRRNAEGYVARAERYRQEMKEL